MWDNQVLIVLVIFNEINRGIEKKTRFCSRVHGGSAKVVTGCSFC